jgi:hypothetical protein
MTTPPQPVQPTPDAATGAGPNELGALTATEQAAYQRYAAIVDQTPYEPVHDDDLPDYHHLLEAGHRTNVAAGNPGTPLTHAVVALFRTQRIPAETCRQIVLTYYRHPPR